MLRIRLSRQGRKKLTAFNIVVAEHTRSAKGKYVEKLGFYNTRSKEIVVDADRIAYWISKGAKPSESMARVLVKTQKYADAKQYTTEIKIPVKKEEVVVPEVKAEVEEVATVEAETPESSEEVVETTPTEEIKVEEVVAEAEPATDAPTEEVKEVADVA